MPYSAFLKYGDVVHMDASNGLNMFCNHENHWFLFFCMEIHKGEEMKFFSIVETNYTHDVLLEQKTASDRTKQHFFRF